MSILSFLRGKLQDDFQDDYQEEVCDNPVVYPFGQPDDEIVIDPARSNDTESVILYYKEKRIFYSNNTTIPINSITDITVCNEANPYLRQNYQIVITMNDGGKYYFSSGEDQEYVNEVLFRLFEIIKNTAQ